MVQVVVHAFLEREFFVESEFLEVQVRQDEQRVAEFVEGDLQVVLVDVVESAVLQEQRLVVQGGQDDLACLLELELVLRHTHSVYDEVVSVLYLLFDSAHPLEHLAHAYETRLLPLLLALEVLVLVRHPFSYPLGYEPGLHQRRLG